MEAVVGVPVAVHHVGMDVRHAVVWKGDEARY